MSIIIGLPYRFLTIETNSHWELFENLALGIV